MFTFLDPTKAPPEMAEPMKKIIPDIEFIENLPSPRIIKTHLPLYLLHPKLLDTAKACFLIFPHEMVFTYRLILGCLRGSESERRHRLLLPPSQTLSSDELQWKFGRVCRLLYEGPRLACAVLSSRSRRLVQTPSSQLALLILRGHEKGICAVTSM